METRSYIVATAGHVDHGKSALVKALTGTDPDRLPEEKARGITIDLGFAHLSIPGPAINGQPSAFHLGIVDVPGHEDFVKNMVAGVGSIDLALLVVAADDGWMPQTEEHLQILTYLGVTRGVVALTKIDLADSEERLRNDVRQKLRGSPLEDAPIVATSAVHGGGMYDLKQTLARALVDTPPQRDIGKPRLPVDRVFTLKGVGTIVTGTLIGGTLKKGQNVVVQPTGIAARVRTIQTHNQEVEQAVPGTRVALNLPDLQPADKALAHGSAAVGRGDVITLAELVSASDAVDVVLLRSDRTEEEAGAGRPIKDGTLMRVHFGSANAPARVYLHGLAELPRGQTAYAQLRFESPVFLFAGDRFILRDWPERFTLAGGRALDPQALRAGFRTAHRLEYLQQLDRAQGAADWISAHLSRVPAGQRSSLLLRSRYSPAEIDQAVARLASEGKLILAENIVADARWWTNLRKLAADAIDAEHKSHPERGGLALADLRSALQKHVPSDVDVFDALFADLARNGFVRSGAAIRRATHRPALPPKLQPAGAKIRAALTSKPLDPPSRKELAGDTLAAQALKFLLSTGEAIEITPDLVLAGELYAKAVEAIRSHLRTRGPATVSDLRQLLGTSRRIMVPLLEKLDREGITLRQGDTRILRSK